MIHAYEDSPNIETKDAVLPLIEHDLTDVRELLPELPADINIYLLNEMLIPETGEGGFAYAPDIMTISFDLNFADKEAQQVALRATVFHEAYHLVQGHTREAPHAKYRSALDSAIYEGGATMFGQRYASQYAPWGDYQQHSTAELAHWENELRATPIEKFYDNDGELWRQWAHYDHSSGVRWRLYKVGVWIVDRALRHSGRDIVDFLLLSASEIEALA